MAMEKFIHWRPEIDKNGKGECFANVHLLLGYGDSFEAISRMVEELRKTFPQASDKKISVGKVTESRRVKSFTIITFNAHIPEGEYPGWDQYRDGRPTEYGWI